MAIAWSKVFSFIGQHAATGLSAVGAAQAAGIHMTPQEMAAIFASAAISGAVNHTRTTATVTKAEPDVVQAPVEPVESTGLQPLPDLIGKWRGTLDAMAMATLGHRMAEDELFNNAKLLEAGDVAGVQKNLDGKK